MKIAPTLGAAVPLVNRRLVAFANQNVGVASAAADVQVGNFGDVPMSPSFDHGRFLGNGQLLGRRHTWTKVRHRCDIRAVGCRAPHGSLDHNFWRKRPIANSVFDWKCGPGGSDSFADQPDFRSSSNRDDERCAAAHRKQRRYRLVVHNVGADGSAFCGDDDVRSAHGAGERLYDSGDVYSDFGQRANGNADDCGQRAR